MATKKRRLTQAQKAASPKLSRLKKKGLFTGNVRRPSKYAVNLTKEFADVLTGQAAVVKTGSKAARQYDGVFRVKRGRVVVPKDKAERVYFDPGRNEIVSRRKTETGVVEATKPKGSVDFADLPQGNVTYAISVGTGKYRRTYRFTSVETLSAFMKLYEVGDNPFANWRNFVQVERGVSRKGVTRQRHLEYITGGRNAIVPGGASNNQRGSTTKKQRRPTRKRRKR